MHTLRYITIYLVFFLVNSVYSQKYIRPDYEYQLLDDGSKMVIITTERFKESVQPLINWKNRKGIRTDLAIYLQDIEEGYLNIAEYIRKRHDEDSVSFFLLVGDAEDIPPYHHIYYHAMNKKMDTTMSDPSYVIWDEEEFDWFCDAFIGRLSANTIEEAEIIINKNIQYEKYPDPTAEWYNSSIVISDTDEYYFQPSSINCTTWANWLVDSMKNIADYKYVEKKYDPNLKESDLFPVFNSGASLIFYNGHGDIFEWLTGDFGNMFMEDDVSLLENGFKMPVIISSGCKNGEFDFPYRPCLAEAWQRQGTLEEGGGAIAFLGGSANIVSCDQHRMYFGITRFLGGTDYLSLGSIIVNSQIGKVTEQNTRRLTLFGDPSLYVYTATPTPINISYKKTDNNSISVTTVPGTIVNLQTPSMNLYITEKVKTETTSFAITSADTEDIYITATGKNKIPFLDTIQYETGIYSNFSKAHTHPNLRNIKIKNKILHLSFGEENLPTTLKLYDIKGRKLFHKKILTEYETIIPIPNNFANTNIIVLKIESAGVKTLIKKISIQ